MTTTNDARETAERIMLGYNRDTVLLDRITSALLAERAAAYSDIARVLMDHYGWSTDVTEELSALAARGEADAPLHPEDGAKRQRTEAEATLNSQPIRSGPLQQESVGHVGSGPPPSASPATSADARAEILAREEPGEPLAPPHAQERERMVERARSYAHAIKLRGHAIDGADLADFALSETAALRKELERARGDADAHRISYLRVRDDAHALRAELARARERAMALIWTMQTARNALVNGDEHASEAIATLDAALHRAARSGTESGSLSVTCATFPANVELSAPSH